MARNRRICDDSAAFGDINAVSWHIRIIGHANVKFSVNIASTHPDTRRDVYNELASDAQNPFLITHSFRNAYTPLGKVITDRARGGVRRYSLRSQFGPYTYSQMQSGVTHIPLIQAVGRAPASSRKIVELRGHSFWSVGNAHRESFVDGAWRNIIPRNVWILALNDISRLPYPWGVWGLVSPRARACKLRDAEDGFPVKAAASHRPLEPLQHLQTRQINLAFSLHAFLPKILE